GWGQDRGRHDSRRAQRPRALSDRDPQARAERGRSAGLRRVRAVTGRAKRADRSGVPRTVTRGRGGVPPAAAAAASLGAALFALPLVGLLWRVPWTGLVDALVAPEAVAAMRLSLVCSLAATVLSVLLGLPLAWVQARGRFPGQTLLRA